MQAKMIHVGKLIKEVFDRQPKGYTVSLFAAHLNCDRRNIYNIFSRAYIDTNTLMRISRVLDHDFFLDLSEAMNKNSSATDPIHAVKRNTNQEA